MIANNYARIMFIYNRFTDYDLSGSNSRYSMLSLIKKKTVLVYKGHQESITNYYVRLCGNLQQFSHCSL